MKPTLFFTNIYFSNKTSRGLIRNNLNKEAKETIYEFNKK